MKPITSLLKALCAVAFAFATLPCFAADYPAPKEGDWVVRDFRFHTGEVLPELRLHLRDRGCAHRRACAGVTWNDPIGDEHARTRLCRRTFRPGAASRCQQVLS